MSGICGRLVLEVRGAKDLADSDRWGTSDPYCIVKLDEEEIGRTVVCDENANPEWNQKFYINMKGEGEVLFEVWDADAMRVDDLLGVASLSTSELKTIGLEHAGEIFEIDLKNLDGSSAGLFSFTLRYREFGGKLSHTGDGKKKSLHIGINYILLPEGKGRLNGCLNDVQTLHNIIVDQFGFSSENAKMLLDADEDFPDPTRENILDGIAWLVDGVKSGDSLLFQFSGHGGQVTDTDGDEIDAKDETLIPCDFKEAGQITDDELYEALVAGLPKGVLLTIIMDCCHSGTGMDLAFVHNLKKTPEEGDLEFDGFVAKKGKEIAVRAADVDAADVSSLRRANQSQKDYDNTSDATVLMLSGCQDDQTSADATINDKPSGAMTFALSSILEKNHGLCSYKELITEMYALLEESGYTQVPQLSTSRPFQLDSTFLM